MRWQDSAECAGTDPGMWHPVEHNPDWGHLRAICAICKTQSECLNHALTHREWQGMWGGLTPNERKDLAGVYRRGKNRYRIES